MRKIRFIKQVKQRSVGTELWLPADQALDLVKRGVAVFVVEQQPLHIKKQIKTQPRQRNAS